MFPRKNEGGFSGAPVIKDRNVLQSMLSCSGPVAMHTSIVNVGWVQVSLAGTESPKL